MNSENPMRVRLTGGLEHTASSVEVRPDGSLVVAFYDFSEEAEQTFGNDVAYTLLVEAASKVKILALLETECEDKRSQDSPDVQLLHLMQQTFCTCMDCGEPFHNRSRFPSTSPERAAKKPTLAANSHPGGTTMSDQTTEWLDVVAKILLRCWIFGFLLLMIWFGFFMLAPNVIYGLHGSMFGLSPQGLNLIHYCGMGLVKLVVICFFFIPWVSIRMVLKKAKG